MLEFNVRHQRLTRIDVFDPAEKSVGYLQARFNFLTDEWKAADTVTLRAKNQAETAVHESKVTDGIATVPWEALDKSGAFSLSLFAKVGEVEITTAAYQVALRQTLDSGLETNPPTPAEFDKLKQDVADLQEQVEDMEHGSGVDEAELKAAVEAALEEAKESGDFDGPAGPAGPQGEQGPVGPQGEVGPAGPQGPQGDPGIPGEPGKDGYTPQKGVDYFDGKDGADGVPGSDGITPHVGENGNWYIGEDDTGIPATGPAGGQGLPGVPGEPGQPGKDGTSPTVSVSAIEGGYRITITDVNGTKTVDVLNGSDGKDGSNGQNGSNGKDGNGIKSDVLNADYTLTLTFDDGASYTTPSIRGAAGASGSNGKDGVSATHSWNGTVLTITSASGTSSADLKGEKGDTGAQGPKGDTGETGPQGPQGDTGPAGPQGEPGADGAKGDKGDKGDPGEQGIQGIQGIQGEKGEKGDKGDTGATGPQGPAGADGKTPVKGTDYYTEADKAEMVNSVLSALPTWTGGSY